MVTAIVIIDCERGMVNSTAQALADIEGVSEVYSVAGRVDLVAIVRVPDNEVLARVVTERILDIESITHTETFIAFQAYSRHDLDRMFSIGLE